MFYKHLAVYFYLQQFVVDRVVLDIGCGYGYGSYILSAKANRVIGIDNLPDRVESASKTYSKAGLNFLLSDAFKIEQHLKNEEVDVITAMEFIEHVQQPRDFLKIAHNLLTPKGHLILSTPNRNFRLKDEESHPWNPEHVQEFSRDTLFSLVSDASFGDVQIKGVSGTPEALEYETKRTGGEKLASVKPMWRYLPEILKIPIRKVINTGLPKGLKPEDYFVVDKVGDSSFGLVLVASKP